MSVGPPPDPAALAALHAATFTTPRPWTAAEITALLALPGTFLTGDATGFALGQTTLDEAELLTIAVAQGARRQGLGSRLLAAFEAEARARGATRAFLEVSAKNVAARALYQGAGWLQTGRRPGYYRAPEGGRIDALILAKPL